MGEDIRPLAKNDMRLLKSDCVWVVACDMTPPELFRIGSNDPTGCSLACSLKVLKRKKRSAAAVDRQIHRKVKNILDRCSDMSASSLIKAPVGVFCRSDKACKAANHKATNMSSVCRSHSETQPTSRFPVVI